MMNKSELSNWFEKKYLEWQLENGRSSLDEFAKILQISRGYLSQILNGDKEKIGYKSALIIADVLKDYSILDLLGYPHPAIDQRIYPFRFLPSELQELLIAASDEIEETLRTRSIQPDSKEGREISDSVLQKFGVKFNSNSKG